jgi:NADPH:quinone reductase-like Zn-dependent oxidoreductase
VRAEELKVRAYHLEAFEKIEGILLRESTQPEPGPHDIVVQVRAASLNRRDIMILEKTYPLPGKQGVIPLSDGAGEVVHVGEKVTRFKVGARVVGNYFPKWRDGRLMPDYIDQLGCTVDGMATQYALLNEEWAAPIPEYLTWEEAACLSCAGLTAWCSLTGSGALRAGHTVLTLGTGDTSLFAVQLAKAMGCRIIATTSQETKAEKLRALGADHVVNYAKNPQWGSEVRELTGNAGVDLVVETMGPETIEQSLIASARHSEIVVLIWKSASQSSMVLPATAYGPKLATIRRLFVGSRADLEAFLKAIELRKIRPVIDRTFGFDDLREAYRYFIRRVGFGKVVLTNF